MDYQNFREYPGERIKREPTLWQHYFRQIIALGLLVLLALLCWVGFGLWHSVPTRGTWQGQFTYYPGEQYYGSFQVTLQMNPHQGDAFTGTLSEPMYGNTIVSVSGTEGDSSLLSQSQLQYVTQLYGNGTGRFIVFTDPTYMQGNQVQLDCTYIAAIYADGSAHGIWFYPGHTQPDGIFILNKVS